jgi:D-beta-D-heptose 7-phosphate kinase/D-beta-D-heptose 1-phosphate adenosyltransferase
VDFVVAFKDSTPLKLIQNVRPDILAKGADYTVEQIVGAKEVLENGGKVLRIKLLKGRSTSKLIELAKR